VGGSASRDGTETYVTLTNRDTRSVHTVEVAFADATPERADGEVLFAEQDPDTVVDADDAADFAAEDLSVSVDGGTLTADLPPATVAGISVQ